jgi:hypothetical protein
MAATSNLKRITGRYIKISKCFIEASQNFIFYFFHDKADKKNWKLSAHIQKVLVWFLRPFIFKNNPFKLVNLQGPVLNRLLLKCSFFLFSDDPAVWGALPLSHDFYAALMAIGGWMEDLRYCKSSLQRKSHLCIPFLGIAQPSCVCDRFIESQDRSTYFLTQNRQTDNGNI